MAKVSVVLLKFSLCFLFIFSVSSTENQQETLSDISTYNAYTTYPEQDYSEIEIKHLSKRDVKVPSPTDQTKQSERIMQTDTTKSTPTSKPTPFVNQTVLVPTQKKLGVNGTGQRTSYDESSHKSPLLETIESKEINKTSVVLNVTEATPTNSTNVISVDNILEEDDAKLNKTLISQNLTSTEDDHLYYTSTFTVNPQVGKDNWVEMENRSDVKVNELLSQSHRRAATVKLSFDFPFYGHLIRNITIATGGFLYTGEYVHSWLAATQYIAPLMANFDTSLSNDSFVKYIDNGTAFIVQWERVALKDKPNEGEFTFQATLNQNGDIIFVYKDVPVIITQIKDDQHPVKVGLSDAYIIDRLVFYLRRKTIYEYHRVHFSRDDIKNWTTIYLHAMPTCLDMKNCSSCLTKVSNFTCKWCVPLNRCSSGVDRHRQTWLSKGCELHQASNVSECTASARKSSDVNAIPKNINHQIDDDYGSLELNAEKAPRIAHSSDTQEIHVVAEQMSGMSTLLVILSITMISSAIGWIFYAYRNPHTSSGQFLIRYRPSQWSWRRGEARYTAATIHM